MKMDSWLGSGRGNGNNRIFSCLKLRIYFLLNFRKDMVTEVVIFVSFNFSIHQGHKRETNQIFRLISKEKRIVAVLKKVCIILLSSSQ